MTNILEKSLLIGFGIFTLLIFFILVMPFIERITDFMNNDEEEYDNSYNILGDNINYDTELLQNDYLMNNEVATTIKGVSEEFNGQHKDYNICLLIF